ncbi:MAG: hypothetical protein IT423_03980 [Pirellulaceae bacterium]|nr:hypothetical protein [Pirellulaceae bacterium]
MGNRLAVVYAVAAVGRTDPREMTGKMTPDTILRSRRDVVWQEQPAGWLAFDPLVRTGYRCGQAQRWLFDQFDGQRTLQQIHRAAAIHSTLQIISWQELHELAKTLQVRGLVQVVGGNSTSISPGNAADKLGEHTQSQDKSARSSASLAFGADDVLVQPQVRHPSGSGRSWLQWFAQSVSWRLRGIDPQWLLRRLAPHTDWLFSGPAVRWWLGLMVCVSLLVLADFSRLMEQATVWDWLIQPASGSTLFIIFVLTRAIHELGHALVLTRLGGRCPDIGLIFMLGAPCVYCDVTESWRLPTARQRAAVAAGGMYAESIVASLSACIWLCTAPGTVNTLALQTMFVCSISTWLVNANPLMRFDGYYILSDWLDEPNLRTRADACLMAYVRRWLTGISDTSAGTHHPHWKRGVGLAVFSFAGFIYRLSLSWMMATLIVALYAAWHFAALGRVIAALLLFCWWVLPAMKFVHHLIRAARTMWARVRLGVLAAWAVLMLCAVPLPYRQAAQGWVQPVSMQGLFVPSAARLQQVLKRSGAVVQPGDVVFRLADDAPRLRAIELNYAVDKRREQLAAMVRQRGLDKSSQVDLGVTEASLASSQLQAHHGNVALSRFTLQSEIAGTLISLPAPKLLDIDNRVVTPAPVLWLDPDQVGRIVPAGTMVAAVCSHEQIAVVPVHDHQLRDIAVGTPVRLLLPSKGDAIWSSHVRSIVRLEQIDSIARLIAEADPDNTASPAQTTATQASAGYAAIVPLPLHESHLNAEVRAVFTVPAKTIASRAIDWSRHNLRWLLPM